MKTPSSYLYDLVHSLSKSEKRYIKVQAGSEDKDYIQLMNALLAQKTFNEEQLIKKHRNAKFVKNLATHKKYLYDLILKSLANFGEKEPEDKVLEKIAAARVLFNKNLAEAAMKELNQGEKIAKKYEFFELQLQILELKKNIVKNHDEKAHYQIFKAESECLALIQNLKDYWYLDMQLTVFYYNFTKIKTDEHKQFIQKIIKDPKIQNLSLATTFKSKNIFYSINSKYQRILGNHEQAYELNRQTLLLYDSYPHFLKLYTKEYIGLLFNDLMSYGNSIQFDRFEEGLQRIKSVTERPELKLHRNKKKYTYIKSFVFVILFRLEVFYLLNQECKTKFQRLLSLIPEIQKGLNEYRRLIEIPYQIYIFYYVALAYFHNKLYKQALDWNNKILNNFKDDTRKGLYYSSKILNLLIHYELKSYYFLESCIPSTAKYLKSRRPLLATEKALFRFLNQGLNSVHKNDKHVLIHEFKEKLKELSLLESEKNLFVSLGLICWIENTE